MLKYFDTIKSPTWRSSTYRNFTYLFFSTGGLLSFLCLVVSAVLVLFGMPTALSWICIPFLAVAFGFSSKARNAEREQTSRVFALTIPAPIPTSLVESPSHRASFLSLPTPSPAVRRAIAWFTFRALFGSICFSIFGLVVVMLASTVLALLASDSSGTVTWWSLVEGLLLIATAILLLAGGTIYVNQIARMYAGSASELLGSYAEQLDVLRQRYDQVAEGERIYRVLHGSIGNTISGISMRASAAHDFFDADPQYARESLALIEDEARKAHGDLKQVLAFLRDQSVVEGGAPSLEDIKRFLDVEQRLGLPLSATIDDKLAAVPDFVLREVYDIVQEGCTNVIRHSSHMPTTVQVTVVEGGIEVKVVNDLPSDISPPNSVSASGRGLRTIAQRANTLGGAFEAGPRDGGRQYLLRVVLPAPSLGE